MLPAITVDASRSYKTKQYQLVLERIQALLDGETDWVSAMATVSCELHHSFDYFHWTGFYRLVAPELLKVGPYQGTHGCLSIPFSKGICGAAARLKETQRVDEVDSFPGHIACSSTTKSEIVVPLLDGNQQTVAVLDVDSNDPKAFDDVDQSFLEQIAAELVKRFFA